MEPVFAPLLSQLESGKGAFAVADLLVKDCLTRMAHTFSMPFPIRLPDHWDMHWTASSKSRSTAS